MTLGSTILERTSAKKEILLLSPKMLISAKEFLPFDVKLMRSIFIDKSLREISSSVSKYLCTAFFDAVRNETTNMKHLLESSKDSQQLIKGMRLKYFFQKIQTDKRFAMTCLKNNQKYLANVSFLGVHSNSKEVSYLPWQDTFCKLKRLLAILSQKSSFELNISKTYSF